MMMMTKGPCSLLSMVSSVLLAAGCFPDEANLGKNLGKTGGGSPSDAGSAANTTAVRLVRFDVVNTAPRLNKPSPDKGTFESGVKLTASFGNPEMLDVINDMYGYDPALKASWIKNKYRPTLRATFGPCQIYDVDGGSMAAYQAAEAEAKAKGAKWLSFGPGAVLVKVGNGSWQALDLHTSPSSPQVTYYTMHLDPAPAVGTQISFRTAVSGVPVIEETVEVPEAIHITQPAMVARDPYFHFPVTTHTPSADLVVTWKTTGKWHGTVQDSGNTRAHFGTPETTSFIEGARHCWFGDYASGTLTIPAAALDWTGCVYRDPDPPDCSHATGTAFLLSYENTHTRKVGTIEVRAGYSGAASPFQLIAPMAKYAP